MPITSYMCSKCGNYYFGGDYCDRCETKRKDSKDHSPMLMFDENEVKKILAQHDETIKILLSGRT